MKHLWSNSNCSASHGRTLIGMIDPTEGPPVGARADERAHEDVPRHVPSRCLQPTNEATPGVIVLAVEAQAEQEDQADGDEDLPLGTSALRRPPSGTRQSRAKGCRRQGISAGLVAPMASSCSASSTSGIPIIPDAEESGNGLVLRDHDCPNDHDSHASKSVPAEKQKAAYEQHARGDEATNDVGGDPLDDLRKQTCIAAASRNLRESRCSHPG